LQGLDLLLQLPHLDLIELAPHIGRGPRRGLRGSSGQAALLVDRRGERASEILKSRRTETPRLASTQAGRLDLARGSGILRNGAGALSALELLEYRLLSEHRSGECRPQEDHPNLVCDPHIARPQKITANDL